MTEVPASLAGPAAGPQPASPSIPSSTAAAAATAAAAEPLLLSGVLERFQRPRVTAVLYLDAEAAGQINAAEQALERAIEYDKTTNEPDTAPELARHLRALEDAAEASKVEFVLQALPHRAYQALRAKYPPTAAQIEAAAKTAGEDREPAFDPDAFSPALVRAQLLAPRVDDDDVFDAFWDQLNDGQLNELWTSALTAQLGVTDPGPKSESASEILRSFGIS
jgi:hypothetical protein